MNIHALQSLAKSIPVFTLQDIRKLYPGFNRNRLTEWQAKNYITKLRRGYYMWADWVQHDEHLFFIANKLYSPSYVSLETALSYYGFIPEASYAFTSVSTKKTSDFQTPVGTYLYHHIQPSLFFGYELISKEGITLKMAEPEKALLDFFYFHPHLTTLDDMESLRFNASQIQERCNAQKFDMYIPLFASQSLHNRVELFKEFYNALT